MRRNQRNFILIRSFCSKKDTIKFSTPAIYNHRKKVDTSGDFNIPLNSKNEEKVKRNIGEIEFSVPVSKHQKAKFQQQQQVQVQQGEESQEQQLQEQQQEQAQFKDLKEEGKEKSQINNNNEIRSSFDQINSLNST